MSNTIPDFQADEFLLDHYVGKTPLVRLQRLASHTQATVLAKLEGNNPAGSVKDRPAYNMIMQAEKRGQIKPGDTLIEATSGNIDDKAIDGQAGHALCGVDRKTDRLFSRIQIDDDTRLDATRTLMADAQHFHAVRAAWQQCAALMRTQPCDDAGNLARPDIQNR